jgi:hypothetical protein
MIKVKSFVNMHSKYFINLFFSIIATCYIYQSVFFGKNYGDASDGTVQMVLHEHWWRWFNGKTSFLDTEFFFPFNKGFGYSDVFIIQGPLHSLLRLLGFEMFSAWSITTFIFLLLGNAGWTFLSIRIFSNKFIIYMFPLSMIFSSSFVSYFQSEPNIVGYTWLSWFSLILVYIHKYYYLDSKKFNILISIFPSLIATYALSCWYGAFFLISSLIVTLFISSIVLFYKGHLTRHLLELLNKLNFKILFSGIPTFAIFISLFIYIYIPVQGDPYRPVTEMISKSPRFKYLINGAHVNDGGLFAGFYSRMNFDSQMDMQLGIGFLTFSILLILLFYYLIRMHNIKNIILFSFFAGSTSLFVYFAVWFEEFSLHSYFFQRIPGLHSIRVPVRFVIFIGYVAIFAIYIFIDRINFKSKNRNIVFLGVIFAVLVLFDQFRIPSQGWDKSIVLNEKLKAQENEIKADCDFFYFDAPGGWWYDQVAAMAFSSSIDVPTTNGNSGAYPPNYPVKSFVHEGDISGMIEWINKIDPTKVGCISNGELPLFRLDRDQERFDIEDGFTPVETDGNNLWRWAIKSNASFFIYSNNKSEKIVEFDMANATCSKFRKIQFSTSPENILQEVTINNESKVIQLKVPMQNSSFQKVLISTSDDPCKIEGDPRNLFYEIKNWKML